MPGANGPGRLPDGALASGGVDEGSNRCSEYGRDVDEFTTIAERWLYYSDGRDLYPYCPPCGKREFSEDAPASAQLPDPAAGRPAGSGLS